MALHREHVFLLETWASADADLAERATHQHLEAGWYRVAAAEGRTQAEADLVERAVSFISTHYASRLEVAWIAANVSFVSASQLTRLFRQKLGMPPHAWIRWLRLERVAAAARSGGIHAGILIREPGEAPGLRRQGFVKSAMDSDLAILRNGFKKALAGSSD